MRFVWFLSAVMIALSAVTAALGGPTMTTEAFLLGIRFALPSALVCLLLCVFVRVSRAALQNEDRPLIAAMKTVRPRLTLFAWCAVGLPLFLTAFTAVKSAIPIIAGFRFDALFTEADAAIFGRDPWSIVASVSGIGPALEFLYLPVWGFLLYYSMGLAAAFADRRKATRLILSFVIAFLVGGVGLAYLLSSGGPMFAHMADPELGARFAPMELLLAEQLSADSHFQRAQQYLETLSVNGVISYGSGISAMPSMHIAVVMIYVLFCRSTWALWPSAVFAVLIYLGSIYSGLHYAVDGVGGVLVAICSWKLSGWLLSPRSAVERPEAAIRVGV